MLTIFANIRINNENALQHLKDSFYSFNTVSDNWLINVRGTFRLEAIDFLTKELGQKIILFQLLDDSRGWIENALEMLPSAKYDYLLLWNEDHLNTAPQTEIVNIVHEMKKYSADYLLYSWWMTGKAREAFNPLFLEKGEFVDTILLTKEKWKEVLANGHPYYLLSLCGIYHKNLFRRLLLKDRIKMPLSFTKNLYRIMTFLNKLGINFPQKKYFNYINTLLFYKLRRFTKEAPFDLEKASDRTDMLPFRIALSKKELFACIDDDLDTSGYQLIKRGKYPLSFLHKLDNLDGVNRQTFVTDAEHEISTVFLSKGNEYRCQYYKNTARTEQLMKENIIITRGKISVEMNNMQSILRIQGGVLVYPNIGYKITALEDSQFLILSNLKKNARQYIGKQGIQK